MRRSIRRRRDTDAPATKRQMLVLVHRIDKEVRRNIRGEVVDSGNADVLADALEGYGHLSVAKDIRDFDSNKLRTSVKTGWGKIEIRYRLRTWRELRARIVDSLRNLREPATQIERRKKHRRFHLRRTELTPGGAEHIATLHAFKKSVGHEGSELWGRGTSAGGPVVRLSADRYELHWLEPVLHGVRPDRPRFILYEVPLDKPIRLVLSNQSVQEIAREHQMSPGVFRQRWRSPNVRTRARTRILTAEIFGWDAVADHKEQLGSKDILERYRRKPL